MSTPAPSTDAAQASQMPQAEAAALARASDEAFTVALQNMATLSRMTPAEQDAKLVELQRKYGRELKPELVALIRLAWGTVEELPRPPASQ